MMRVSAIAAGFLLAACGSDVPTEEAGAPALETVLAEPEVPALPEFNTYTDEQMAVLSAFGMSAFEDTEITVQPLHSGLAVMFGIGGNVLVSIGEDGVIMVDNQFPEIHEALLSEIQKLGGDKVGYVINTHWHFDHAEGNRAFGPLGAEIIAHENSAEYMARDNNINLVIVQYPQQAYPEDALPDTSYSDTLELSLNGQEIILYHFGPAHTTGDTQVYFKTANVIHMGDVGNFTPVPFIDVDNGGDIDGVISTVRAVLERIDDETIVVPGHGEVGDKARLAEFADWLETIRSKVLAYKADGKTVQEVQAANAAGELGAEYHPMLIDRVYMSAGE